MNTYVAWAYVPATTPARDERFAQVLTSPLGTVAAVVTGAPTWTEAREVVAVVLGLEESEVEIFALRQIQNPA